MKNKYSYGYCKVCGKYHSGSKTVLMHGASRAAVDRDMEQSDREYIAQRQRKRKKSLGVMPPTFFGPPGKLRAPFKTRRTLFTIRPRESFRVASKPFSERAARQTGLILVNSLLALELSLAGGIATSVGTLFLEGAEGIFPAILGLGFTFLKFKKKEAVPEAFRA